MTKIEAPSLEQAYRDAAVALECSITELNIEVVQASSNGFLGLFKKSAIIIVTKKTSEIKEDKTKVSEPKKITEVSKSEKTTQEPKKSKTNKTKNKVEKVKDKKTAHNMLNDTIMPQSFVSTQDDEDYDMSDINFTADYEEDEEDVSTQEKFVPSQDLNKVSQEVSHDINKLFNLTCFDIDSVDVSVYDENTLLVEFKGKDAALLIGKEGYRYKALSYMIFNWINTKYQLQLRLEIAEFLKNQEESVARYLEGVYESVDRDGRCQTKILDGVLIQIALRSLREKYSDKYVAIRSTRDGLKYIIINDYHSN